MKLNFIKTVLVAAGLAVGAGAWADVTTSTTTIDSQKYNVRTFDFTSWTGDLTLVEGDAYCKVGRMGISTITAPADFTDYIALQGVGNGSNNGWTLKDNKGNFVASLLSSNGTRSAVIKNLPVGAIAEIYSTTASFAESTGGAGAAVYTENTLTGGISATITQAGDLGFSEPSGGKITKIVIYTVSAGVDKPTGKLTGVNGTSRTVTFETPTPDAKLLLSDKEDGEYVEFDGTYTVSQTMTVYVKAQLDGVDSEILAYEIQAGTEVKLNAPVLAKTAWANGKATYSLSNSQTGVLLTPAATVVCSDNTIDATGSSVALPEGVYTFHAESAGYANSDDVTVNVVADREMTLVETLDYSSICSSYNAAVSLDKTNAVYNDGARDYYSFAYAAEYSEDAKEDRLLSNNVVFARSGYGLQNQQTKEYFVALTGLKAGQIVKFTCGNTGGNALGFVPTESDKAVVANESTVSVPAIEVLQDGTIAFTIGRLSYIKKIEIYSLPVEVSVGEYSYATYCPSVGLDFSTVDEIKAYSAKVDGNVVRMTEVQTVAAGEGVLLASVSGGVASVEVPVKAGVEKNEGNELVGTLTDIESLATEGGNGVTNFILNVGDGITGFYKAAGKKVAAGKAYLPVADYDSASEAKGLTLVFGGEETGISEVSGAVRNGSEQWYTISGQRVCAPSKGLYIVNGKKVIVK